MRKPALLLDPVEEAGGPHWLRRTYDDSEAPEVAVHTDQSDDHVRAYSVDRMRRAAPSVKRERREEQYMFDLPIHNLHEG